jgi:hypothetical protein
LRSAFGLQTGSENDLDAWRCSARRWLNEGEETMANAKKPTRRATARRSNTLPVTGKRAPAKRTLDAGAPAVPLSKAAAKQALARETSALKQLAVGARRDDWQIGKRLSQIAELGLHRAAGFTTIDDYAEKELALARTKTFQFMRVAAAFSQAMVVAHGMDKLEAVLGYFKATPEDDGPADVPDLKVPVADAKGRLHDEPFADVTVREIAAARKRELGGRSKRQPPAIALHAHAAAAGVRAVRGVVGRSNAARVALDLGSADGIVTFDLRGVPLAVGPRALRALAAALEKAAEKK